MSDNDLNIMVKNHLDSMERELKVVRRLVHQNHSNFETTMVCDDHLIPLEQTLIGVQRCLEGKL